MSLHPKFFAGLLASAMLVAPTAVYAAYDQTLFLDGPGGDAIESSQLSFTTDSGVQVPVEYSDEYDEDDDDGAFVIVFPGNASESGTLTYPGRDGRPATVRIPAAQPGQAVTVNVETGRVSTGPKPMMYRPQVGSPFNSPLIYGGGGATNTEVPQASYGVTDLGGSESFLVSTKAKLDYGTYGGGFSIPLGGLSIGGGYIHGSGSGQSSGSVEPGGETSGFVFIGESSEFGTGVALGTAGLDVDTQTRLEWDSGYLKIGLPLVFEGGDTFIPRLKIGYTDREVVQWAGFSTPTYPGEVTSDVVEQLDLNRWTLGLGGDYYVPVAERLYFGLGGDVRLHFDDFKLSATQSINVFGTTDTVSVSESQDGTHFGVGGEISATYMFTEKVGINLFGRIDYDENFGQIVNPRTGDDVLAGDTARIGDEDSTSYTFGARLGITF
jgi:hypothetical protein